MLSEVLFQNAHINCNAKRESRMKREFQTQIMFYNDKLFSFFGLFVFQSAQKAAPRQAEEAYDSQEANVTSDVTRVKWIIAKIVCTHTGPFTGPMFPVGRPAYTFLQIFLFSISYLFFVWSPGNLLEALQVSLQCSWLAAQS